MEHSPSTPCKHRIALVELAHRFVRTFCDIAFVPYELTAEAKRPSSGQYFSLIASHVPSLSDEVVDAELVHFRRTDYLDDYLPDINRFFESDSHLFSELCSAINSRCFDQLMEDFQKLDASFVVKAQFITEDSFHRDLLEESVCVVSGAQDGRLSCECLMSERSSFSLKIGVEKLQHLHLPFDKVSMFEKAARKVTSD